MNMQRFIHCLLETGKVSAMIFTILTGAMVFGYFMSLAQLPMAAADWMGGLPVHPIVVMIGIMVIYLILGCFMDSMAMIMLTVPIFFPVITQLGFDPIWFGVIVVTTMEEGLITPPVGMNLYVVKGIAKGVKLEQIYKGVLPFVGTIVLFQIVLLAFPQIATFIPLTMGK
jgi:tripartite ATP-independent transporter DctM subunit